MNLETTATVVSEGGVQTNRTIRAAVLEAAGQARLTLVERAQLRKLMRYQRERLEAELIGDASAEGAIKAGAKPDDLIEGAETWIVLVKLFIELLPVILAWFDKGLIRPQFRDRSRIANVN